MKTIYVNWEERLIISNEEEANEVILSNYMGDDVEIISNYINAHYTAFDVWNFSVKEKLEIEERARKWAKRKARKEFLERWDQIAIS